MTQFPVQPRASTPAIVVAGAISLLLHAGLGVGLAKYRVPAHAGPSDIDLGVEVLLPAEGTGLPPQVELPPQQLAVTPPPSEQPEAAARLNLSAAVPPTAPQLQPPPLPPEPQPEPPQDIVRLGTDDGVGITDNMLGAAQATPHSAIQGSVDQPALSLAPGAPGPTGEQAPQPSAQAADPGTGGADGQTGGNTQEQPATSEQPQQAPEEETREPQPAQATPPPQAPAPSEPAPLPPPPQEEPAVITPPAMPIAPPRETSAPVSTESVFTPEREASPAPSDADNVFQLPQPQPVTVVDEFGEAPTPPPAGPEPTPPTAPAEPPAPEPTPPTPQPTPDPLKEEARVSLTPLTPTPAPVSPPAVSSPAPGPAGSPAPTGGDSRLPGVTSDAESTAVSTQPMLEFKPGMPLTGKGIRIRTVVPRFSTTTRLTAVPRNPVVVIRFNRAGRVVKAEFENNQGTGYRDVDEPLLDAVYRWTAAGEQLNRIPAGTNETLTFRIRYLLNDD